MSVNCAAIPHEVEFNSNRLLLIEFQGTPYVPLEPVLSGIGLNWRSPMVKQALKRFRTNLAEIPISCDGRNNLMKCMPLNKLPAWLIAFDQGAVIASVRKNLTLYQNGCDEALWKYWLSKRAHTAPAVSLIYEGHRFRFRTIGSECWYVASDVTAALGLGNTAGWVNMLPQHMQLTQQIVGRRYLTINQAGLDQAYLVAPPNCTERLRQWLAKVSNDRPAPITSAEVYVRQQSANATLDYLTRSRAALREAGIEPIEWDETCAQQIAEHLPWLLIRDQRWLFTFSKDGNPQFSAVPQTAGIFTPETVVRWVREQDGADLKLIPQLLSAIGERLRMD